MKKVIFATLLAGTALSVVSFASADETNGMTKPKVMEEAAAYEEKEALPMILAKAGVPKSYDEDEDDDDDEDEDEEDEKKKYGAKGEYDDDDDDDDDDYEDEDEDEDEEEYSKKQASAPVGSVPVPDNGLFVPGSKPSVTVQ